MGRRRVTIRRHVEALVRFGDGVANHLADKEVGGADLRRRMQAAFEAKAGALPGVLAPRRGALRDSLKRVIAEQILPNLHSGATDATEECSATARGWSAHRSEGGLHWATYRATVRRDGEFRINMNEQLSEPVFRAVSTYWERVFVGKLREELETFRLGAHEALKRFLDDATAAVVAEGGDAARVEAMRRPLEETLHAALAVDVVGCCNLNSFFYPCGLKDVYGFAKSLHILCNV